MPPRNSSANTQQGAAKTRIAARARVMSGAGSMTDAVDAALLKQELKGFYDQRTGLQDVSPGLIALNRCKRALDTIASAATGPSRITKVVTRILWTLLTVEMKFVLKANDAATVQPLSRFCDILKTRGQRPNTSWDMGVVRDLLAQGWPSEQNVHRLKTIELGPLTWWLASDTIETRPPPLRRQDIYDAAVLALERSRAPHPSSRPPSPSAPSASRSTRRSRPAAKASEQALNGAVILDDDAGSTYTPSDAEPPTKFTFGAGTAAEFTVNAPAPALPPPPPPPPPTAEAPRRSNPSPWLPPTGFSTNIDWTIANYNDHKTMLLNWDKAIPLPDGLLWAHPNMHGLRVDEDGQCAQFRVSCNPCEKNLNKCMPRGAKACLSCYWNKGSDGKCEGGQPPENNKDCKPDMQIRYDFLMELVNAGVIEWPSHYLDKQGRALHGAASGGAGRPPPYASAARADGPSNAAASAASAAPVASASAPPAPPQQGTPGAPSRSSRSQAPTRTSPATTTDAAQNAGAASQLRGSDRSARNGHANSPAQAEPVRASPARRPLEDVPMSDLSNAPAASRKRPRDRGNTADENRATDEPSEPQEVAAPRARKRVRAEEPAPQPAVPEAGDSSSATVSTRDASPTLHRTAASPSETRDEADDEDEDMQSTPPAVEPPVTVSEGEDRPGRVRGSARAKGKARAIPRNAGVEQRSGALPINRAVQFYDPVPGTRSVPRAGSPTEYRVRPTPVIPDQDMRIQGDRTYEMPTGVSKITHPHPGPPPTSTVNVSGDILLANHVERAMRHEAREIRDQMKDWFVGRYQTEHVLPLHRELLQALAKHNSPGASGVDANVAGGELVRAEPSGPRRPTVQSPLLDSSPPLGHVAPATQSSVAHQGISEARMTEMLAGLTESMQKSLTVQTAPLNEGMADLTRRLREMEPIGGRVSEMADDLRALTARVRRLEDAGFVADNVRTIPDARRSVSAGRSSPPGANASQGPLAPRRRETQAPTTAAHSQSPRPPGGSRDSAAVPSPSRSLLPLAVPVEAPSESRAPDATTPSHRGGSLPLPEAQRPSHPLATAPASLPPASPESPTPAPRARASARSAAGTRLTPSPRQEGMSPLTDPSPGRVIATPSPTASKVQSDGPRDLGVEHYGSEDDEPMETGETWTAGSRRKRDAEGLGEADEEPAPKRHAGEGDGADEDEDAEGSADDAAAPHTPPPVAPRGARPAKKPRPPPAVTPGGRPGLRTRNARGG